MRISSSSRRAARGFTLIELMITVAIVGILAAIALPAYDQIVMKSRRGDAKAALLDLAQKEERNFSTTNQYELNAMTSLGYPTGTALPIQVLSGSSAYYELSIVPDSTAPAGLPSFLATAKAKGAQTKDKCGNYTLNSRGVEGVFGGALAVADCW